MHPMFLSEVEQSNPGGAYAISGERLATFGYVSPETSAGGSW